MYTRRYYTQHCSSWERVKHASFVQCNSDAHIRRHHGRLGDKRRELRGQLQLNGTRARSGGVIGQRPGGDSGSKDSGSDEDEPEALASK